VLGVRVGQLFEIVSSDATLHNVHATPSANREFNIGQPVSGMRFRHTFTEPEVMVPLTSDIHKWMAAFVGAVAFSSTFKGEKRRGWACHPQETRMSYVQDIRREVERVRLKRPWPLFCSCAKSRARAKKAWVTTESARSIAQLGTLCVPHRLCSGTTCRDEWSLSSR